MNEREPQTSRSAVDEYRTALVTAHLTGDDAAMTVAMAGLGEADLAPLLGGMTAYVGNMVKLIAQEWDCSPLEAWEAITTAAREIGLP